jgi:RNA polymerase sigma-70 factor (ECF subfamily)
VPVEPIQLLSAVATGDESALGALYDAFSPAIYGVVLRMVEKEELAQEVLQDTFVKIWKNAPSYDSAKGRPFTWMVNIARHAAIDMLRSSEVKRGEMIRPINDHVYRLGSDDLNTSLEDADVRSVLHGLRQEHRELIDLAYYKGFSQQDIADRTGIPLGTVKSRTRSALQELRTLLKDHR